MLVINPCMSFAQQPVDKNLFKWQDNTGKWHYSKTPPQPNSPVSNKIEIAKDTRTIIFEEQTNNASSQEQEITAAEQKARQQRGICQLIQSYMMDTALYIRKTNDKNFQEKNITVEEYDQEKLSITKLEEIGSDINFYDTCMEDFSKKPQIKAISSCMIEQNKIKDRVNCLKELPPI